jgi:hypothetical protein
MNSKTIQLFLALGLVATLAACGGGGGQPTASPSASPAEGTSPAASPAEGASPAASPAESPSPQ